MPHHASGHAAPKPTHDEQAARIGRRIDASHRQPTKLMLPSRTRTEQPPPKKKTVVNHDDDSSEDEASAKKKPAADSSEDEAPLSERKKERK